MDKIITRVRNVTKRAKIKRPSSAAESPLPDAKRVKNPLMKGKELLLRRYPVGVSVEVLATDHDSLEVHNKQMNLPSLNLEILSCSRCSNLLTMSEAISVKQILEKYPALRRLSIVS